MARHRRTSRSSSREAPANQVPASGPRLTVAKKLLFSLVATILFFMAVELILMVAGWQPVLDESDPYVGFFSLNPLFVETVGADGARRLVTAQNKMKWFNRQCFPRRKAANTYRIFCLGGSTTYGRPYDDMTSFAGWLRALLPEVDRNRQWEVINAGGISYASYRVVNVMHELLEYDPDLFVIYSGHNEFLEARTYGNLSETPGLVARLEHILGHTRTYTALRRLVKGTDRGNAPLDLRGKRSLLPSEVDTLLDSALGPQVYHRDDELRKHIVTHYEFNLRRMVRMGRRAGARVLLVTPASSLSNCSPFKSEHRADMTAAAREEWESSFTRARELFKSGDLKGAIHAANRSVEIDPRYAGALYLRARIRLALGNDAKAREDFVAARQEDVCTLRAPNEILQVVRRVASEMKTPHVDFAAYVDRVSPHGIPGDNLFLDHVHPTIEGNRDLAVLLITCLRDAGIIASPADLDARLLTTVTERVMRRVDRTKQSAALRNLSKVLSWAGKKEEADGLALRAVQLDPDDAETQYQAGNAFMRCGKIDEAIRCYQRTFELNAEYAAAVNASLGFAYAAKGDQDQAMEYYLKALTLNPNFGDVHYNIGVICEDRGETEDAMRHYRSAVASRPQHFVAHSRLGMLLAKQQKWDEARAQFEQALRINPNFVEARVNLGKVLARQGHTTLARQQFRWVLRRYPGHPVAKAELDRLE